MLPGQRSPSAISVFVVFFNVFFVSSAKLSPERYYWDPRTGVGVGVRVVVGWGGGYLLLHCHHQSNFCIKMGSDHIFFYFLFFFMYQSPWGHDHETEFPILRMENQHTRELISGRRRHTNTTAKTWAAYGNSHLACERIQDTQTPPEVHRTVSALGLVCLNKIVFIHRNHKLNK